MPESHSSKYSRRGRSNKMRLSSAYLAATLPFAFALHLIRPFDANASTGFEESVAQKPAKITADINIKGVDPKNLKFDVILPATLSPNTKILYDRAVEGDMCFISCNFYNGVTSKWSDFYVYVQPFENFCLTLTGCASQYPSPSADIQIIVDGQRYPIKISDPESNGYYLPLDVRQTIASSSSQIAIEISGVKMPLYKVGARNSALIKQVVNTITELESAQTGSNTKEQRLKELQALFDKGLISEQELEAARMKILSE